MTIMNRSCFRLFWRIIIVCPQSSACLPIRFWVSTFVVPTAQEEDYEVRVENLR